MKRYLIKEFSLSHTPVQNEIVISIELGRETRIIEEDGRKNCLLALTLTAFGRADETDYLTIKASMEGVFECQETLEEKALEMVAESGTSILLPVLRAAILSFYRAGRPYTSNCYSTYESTFFFGSRKEVKSLYTLPQLFIELLD